jgi:ephrin-A
VAGKTFPLWENDAWSGTPVNGAVAVRNSRKNLVNEIADLVDNGYEMAAGTSLRGEEFVRRVGDEMPIGAGTEPLATGAGVGCPRRGQSGVISYRALSFGEKLGEGAFGTVVLGRYNGKKVAIKTIKGTPSPSAMTEFQEEAELLANIKPHPNVVRFIGITLNRPEQRKPMVLVTEFVDGGALDSRLQPGKPAVTWRDIGQWARDIAAGLEHLHRNSILHRDLAARNVLIERATNRAKITDFGLSVRVCTPQGPFLDMQQQEFFRGPYKWMAPESLAYQQFSVKSDVWSYGVTLWEILSRRPQPFEFLNIEQAKAGVINNRLRLPVPSRWPGEFRQLLANCWRTDRNLRPTGAQIVKLLDDIAAKVTSGQGKYGFLPAISDTEVRQLY